MRGLTDKVAVVVGAGSGIGRATAIRLSQEGAGVAVVDVNADAAAETARQINAHRDSGPEAVALTADATSPSQIAEVTLATVERFGGVDILVNCVVRGSRKNMYEVTLEEWQTTIDGCLHSYFIPIKAALPHLVASGHGKIVNVCSSAAHMAFEIPAYTAAKGAILAWSREMAAELAHFGINVNSVSPGIIDTPLNANALSDEAQRALALQAAPAGRLGQPDDIASAIAFLASSEADFITGADLRVDGGLTSASPYGGARDTWKSYVGN